MCCFMPRKSQDQKTGTSSCQSSSEKRVHFVVAGEDLVLIASPGQCEVCYAVVPVARLEVEEAGEPIVLEE